MLYLLLYKSWIFLLNIIIQMLWLGIVKQWQGNVDRCCFRFTTFYPGILIQINNNNNNDNDNDNDNDNENDNNNENDDDDDSDDINIDNDAYNNTDNNIDNDDDNDDDHDIGFNDFWNDDDSMIIKKPVLPQYNIYKWLMWEYQG